VLDPLHKEAIVATAAGNTVETFYLPEAFETNPTTSSTGSASAGQ